MESLAVKCPQCDSNRLFRDGLRYLNDGSGVQRFLCRSCGYRFSFGHNISKVKSDIPSKRQVCDILTVESKNLTTVEIRQEEAQRKATETTSGKIIEFAWQMKRRNLSQATIETRVYRLNQLVKMGADLMNPESVETILATEDMTQAKKRFLVQSYRSFTKHFKIDWTPIKIRCESKQPFIPLETEIDQMIAGCSKKVATFLQIAKTTGARLGEIVRLKWTDVNTENMTISINYPLKGSMSRTIKVSDKTIAMINELPKNTDYLFSQNIKSLQHSFIIQRKRLAESLKNPRLKQIHFHTLRHWFATMLYQKTKNILLVKQQLGHKRLENTEIYTHLINFESDEYNSATAQTIEETQKLIEAGFEYVCDIQETKLFRRRK